MKKLVSQLSHQSYLQLEGGVLETAHPTVAAVQKQSPSESGEAARVLIEKAKA